MGAVVSCVSEDWNFPHRVSPLSRVRSMCDASEFVYWQHPIITSSCWSKCAVQEKRFKAMFASQTALHLFNRSGVFATSNFEKLDSSLRISYPSHFPCICCRHCLCPILHDIRFPLVWRFTLICTSSLITITARSHNQANRALLFNRSNPSSRPLAPASWLLSTALERSCKPSSLESSPSSTSSSRASHAAAEGEDVAPAEVMSSPSSPHSRPHATGKRERRGRECIHCWG